MNFNTNSLSTINVKKVSLIKEMAKSDMDQFSKMDEILIKYITGSATIEERDMARKWINENHNNQKYFDELKEYYQVSMLVKTPSGYKIEEGWSRVKSGYYKKKFLAEQKKVMMFRKKTIRITSLAAAIIFIALILSTLLYNNSGGKHILSQNPDNEIVVPLGAKSQIILSDGTKVWLNAGSKLRFPVNFLSDIREVYLEGEAFFDVSKNMKKLFVVKTSGINVKVYGTQFNIKSYPEENQIQTTLVKGVVTIEQADGKPAKKIIYLKPNETATYYKSSSNIDIIDREDVSLKKIKVENPAEKIIIAPKTDVLPIISWKDNRWVIDGEELKSLAIKLERRYNVKITFENENLKYYKFSGTLTNETFEQVLKVMQLSAPILFSIDGNNVVFKEDPLYKKKYDKSISNLN